MAHDAFRRTQPEVLQSSADAAEVHALQRFLRWMELARAVRVALRCDELSARLDSALRRGIP
jgi:hypothetical protein